MNECQCCGKIKSAKIQKLKCLDCGHAKDECTCEDDPHCDKCGKLMGKCTCKDEKHCNNSQLSNPFASGTSVKKKLIKT